MVNTLLTAIIDSGEISLSDCREIVRLDTANEDSVERNCAQLSIMLNTYRGILTSIERMYNVAPLSEIIFNKIRTYGLVRVQASFDLLYGRYIVSDTGINAFSIDTDIAPYIATICSGTDGLHHAAVVLRFFKRFTYIMPDTPEAYEKFLKCNRECYSSKTIPFNSKPYTGDGGDGPSLNKPSEFLMEQMRYEVGSMLKHVTPEKVSPLNWGFSSGSTAEGLKLTAEKIGFICTHDPRWHAYPDLRCGNGSGKPDSFATPHAIQVPKTLTSRRVIFPEPTIRGFKAMALRRALESGLSKSRFRRFISWDNQEVNRDLAFTGSIDGSYATIDLSSASDTISRELAFQVIPERLRSIFYSAITDYIVVDGKTVRVRMMSSSGNQITWLFEAIWFLAIARIGCRLSGYKDSAYAYGDDLIVPSGAYDCVCDLLAIFGHKVNLTKSYAEGLFRESCGREFYGGLDCSAVYWPRRIVDINDGMPLLMASICSLQHRCYEFHGASAFLSRLARRIDPKITTSPVGVDCEDLWDGGCTMSEYENTRHRHLVSHFKCDKYPQTYMDWMYYSFLLNGPFYRSEEDEMWGISTPYLNESDVVAPTFRWR